MAQCKFCGATFRNPQAVRAHLKGCPAYHAQGAMNADRKATLGTASSGTLPLRQNGMPKASLPRENGQQITGSDPGSRLKEDAVETVLELHEDLRGMRNELEPISK